MSRNFVIGVDYGTDSVRSVIVDTVNGQEVGTSVFHYPRWKDGMYCNVSLNQFRQHPLDYIEGLESVIKNSLAEAGEAVRENIRAISIDTTGSTPIAVDETGTPLSLLPGFENDPDAMFVLWKDHSSIKEMMEINGHAKKNQTDYLKYVGGIYSSEWFWSKLLHVLRNNEKIRSACYSWVEHADWMPFLLTGGKHISEMKRNVCTAGHKGLWSQDWNGLPPDDFFSSLDPLLKGFTTRLYKETFTADKPAGNLSAEWAEKLGLNTNVVVGIGAMDAHVGAVGGQIEPYYLSKVMGTSTCDMLVAPVSEMQGKFIRGICGLVDGSVIPGMIGMEAGQSAFGDVYAWFKNLLAWPLRNMGLPSSVPENSIDEMVEKIIPALSKQASQLLFDEDSELSTDWFNGRRTPDANPFLKGSITGLNLGSDAPKIFRSLAEATCFGAKAIVERFIEQGVPVKGLIGIGGVARKSAFIMQMMADVLGIPIKINKSEQTSALGAAMFAATAACIYEKVEDAMNAMGQGFDITYYPDKTKAEMYEKRYKQYLEIGDLKL
ncbi:MAG: ribulokinase [Bacteroidetes bacterium]|nr:ribulokinase [Bacteroidota bacterium]MBS1973687.1 ribulokinase [Bacteroidota bacterium]